MASLRPQDNRALLNAANRAADPDYYGPPMLDQTTAETARLANYENSAVAQEQARNRGLLNTANQAADPDYYKPPMPNQTYAETGRLMQYENAAISQATAQSAANTGRRYDFTDDANAFDNPPIRLSNPDGAQLAFYKEAVPMAQKLLPKVAPSLLPEAAARANPIGLGLALFLHMDDAPKTGWDMGGQSFSYNPDDMKMTVTSRYGEPGGAPATVIPQISNPSRYTDVQYLEYLTYKANGGSMATHDFIATGMPQPGSEPVTAPAGDGGNWLNSVDRATIHGVNGQVLMPGAITAKVLPYYQQAFDSGYAFALEKLAAGKVVVPANVPERTVLGQIADEQARLEMKIALAPGGALHHLNDAVLVNRYLYDPSGSGKYAIPDIRIPSEGVIIDGTIGYKDNATPQVQKFFQYSPTTRMVVIVSPNTPQAILRPKGK